jgi:hypothetical protein
MSTAVGLWGERGFQRGRHGLNDSQRSVASMSQSWDFREKGQHLCSSWQMISFHLLPSFTNGLEAVFKGEMENVIFSHIFLLLLKLQSKILLGRDMINKCHLKTWRKCSLRKFEFSVQFRSANTLCFLCQVCFEDCSSTTEGVNYEDTLSLHSRVLEVSRLYRKYILKALWLVYMMIKITKYFSYLYEKNHTGIA